MDSLFEHTEELEHEVEANVNVEIQNAAPKVFVSDLRVGGDVDSCFVITRLTLREYDRGKFISFRLADKTGKISAVLWENAETVAKLLKDGDLVQVQGRVNSYQDEPQIAIRSITPVSDCKDIDPKDFLPTSPVPLEKMLADFDRVISEMQDGDLEELLLRLRQCPDIWEPFTQAPGAKMWHHPYVHGLLEHTLSVVHLCRCIGPQYPGVDVDLLVAGAIFHDIGKLSEFEYRYRIDYSTEGRLLGHIYIGCSILERFLSDMPEFPAEKRRQLLHIVLSHHGETERSPILPMTLEAALLHHIENMDAQMMAFIREMNKARDEEQNWTQYVNLIQRYLYLGERTNENQNTTLSSENEG